MNGRIIAIGDIHGCYNTLMFLLEKINPDYNKDKIVFLGDYIDRGKYPLETITTVKELTEKYPNNVIALMGNHEKMCIDAMDGDLEIYDIWKYNGGGITSQEISQLNDFEKTSILNWIKNLPLRYEINNYGFCHSGWWGDEKDKYGYDKTLWNRDWLYDEKISPTGVDKIIIFGHTPLNEPIWVDDKSLDIDTGCVFGRELTCAVIENDELSTYSAKINDEDRWG